MKIQKHSNASLLIVFNFINSKKEICKYTVFYKNAQKHAQCNQIYMYLEKKKYNW